MLCFQSKAHLLQFPYVLLLGAKGPQNQALLKHLSLRKGAPPFARSPGHISPATLGHSTADNSLVTALESLANAIQNIDMPPIPGKCRCLIFSDYYRNPGLYDAASFLTQSNLDILPA
eukprot:superscaffoldBa00006987_g22113